MKHELSFGWITFIEKNIIEVVINQGVNVSLEMAEEYSDFLADNFQQPFGILVNKINDYQYSIEATLILHSDINLKAIAAVEYSPLGKNSTHSILKKREMDALNVHSFCGLELGWQKAVDWLRAELTHVK